jgi:SAM-dependent methyltransferase
VVPTRLASPHRPIVTTNAPDVLETFEEASHCLASVRDIIDERSTGQAPPTWCVRRGFTDFLRALPDEALVALERDGLGAHVAGLPDAPDSLVQLAHDVRRLTKLPRAREVSAHEVRERRTSPRKRVQVAAFAALVEGLSTTAWRIVDLGSGHGHLTRHLAHALGVPAEGWERDPARAEVARSLVSDGRARFLVADVRDLGAKLTSHDLVVGLHACGALGDLTIQGAIEARAAVALVACCPQKCKGARIPLSVARGLSVDALTLPHAALGLGNVRDGDTRVETDWAACVDARVRRMALRNTFVAAGHPMEHGEEMRGLNRRRAADPLRELVARAFALRGLPLPSSTLIEASETKALEDHRLARRWELPRTMLARLVEVWMAFDRAARLRTNGYAVEVREVFSSAISPRNVAVLGKAE